jgi:hypothetical protein
MGRNCSGFLNCFALFNFSWIAICLQATSATHPQRKELTGEVFKPVVTQLNANLDSLHAVSLSSDEVGYNVDDVNAVLSQVHDEVTARIPPDDAPLRKYVENRLPSRVASAIPQVERQYANSLFDQVKKLLNSLTALPSFTLNLQVNSSPPRALFELVPPSGVHLSTATNSSITNIYRGEYQYVVTKAGFKTATFTVNFIDRAGTTLDCDLIENSLAQSALPCALK